MTFDLSESDADTNNVELGQGGNNRENYAATAGNYASIRATLSSEEYDADSIRAEFKTYHSFLPKPDQLLQQQPSADAIREMISASNCKLPRWLVPKDQGGIAPHDALCSLLLKEMNTKDVPYTWWFVRILSLGFYYPSINLPADVIREQFHLIAHVVPSDVVRPTNLRRMIRHQSLPVPNFFLDPEDEKQFPPHIAMLVVLQDGESESAHMVNIFHRLAWFLFATLAFLLRLVLEVIGGAGAIWGGSEVFGLRYSETQELWRWLSVFVGALCFLRFVTLNAPRQEDEGDVMGPAGPWSLRPALRLRAVCDHPFHYLVRAQRPFIFQTGKESKNT